MSCTHPSRRRIAALRSRRRPGCRCNSITNERTWRVGGAVGGSDQDRRPQPRDARARARAAPRGRRLRSHARRAQVERGDARRLRDRSLVRRAGTEARRARIEGPRGRRGLRRAAALLLPPRRRGGGGADGACGESRARRVLCRGPGPPAMARHRADAGSRASGGGPRGRRGRRVRRRRDRHRGGWAPPRRAGVRAVLGNRRATRAPRHPAPRLRRAQPGPRRPTTSRTCSGFRSRRRSRSSA